MFSGSELIARDRRALLFALLFVALAAASAACGESSQPHAEPSHDAHEVHVALEGDEDASAVFVLDGRFAVHEAFAGPAVFEASDEPFSRVDMRFDAHAGDPALEYRVRRAGTVWSAWAPLPVTWNEGIAYNAHIELPDGPAEALELRGEVAAAELAFVLVHLVDGPPPEPEPAADEAPHTDTRYRTATQALTLPSFVKTRAQWGARSTGTCGSSHWPSHVTIHHTVTPNNDSMTPEQRMRQMQAFHIDSRNWCDIGYHFVVSHDGRIWQGRASHERSGAHVGGHNANNVGISFMGNYQEAQVPQAMLDGTRPLVDWLMNRYNIPRNRTRLKGHREWSGQSTSCPGSHLLGRLEELLAAPGPAPDPEAGLPTGCRSDSSFTGAFCDDEGHFAEKDINYIEARGVTNGCSAINGKPAYCPQNITTRAQTITMLGRISGMPRSGHPQIFTDLDGLSQETRDYAHAAAAFGITNGCGGTGTTFCPGDPLTRSALAAFIVRAWHLPPPTKDHFDDDAGSPFEDVHNRLAEAGITHGCGDREFCGSQQVSRAVLAVMLARIHRLGLPAVWELPQACLEGATFTPAFCDDDGHWGEDAIDHIAAEGITNGCGEMFGKPIYCPDKAASRIAGITMIGRASRMPLGGHPEVFTDLDGLNQEMRDYAHAAAALGVTNGCGSTGTTFCPRDSLSRSALGAFVARAWALPAATQDHFDDDAGSPFEDVHNRLAEAGITHGCDTRAFCGSREATRAVLAAFISRALTLGLVPAWEQSSPPAMPITDMPDPDAEPTPTADGEGETPIELPEGPTAQPNDPGADPTDPSAPPSSGGNASSDGCTIIAAPTSGTPLPRGLVAAMLLAMVALVARRRRV